MDIYGESMDFPSNVGAAMPLAPPMFDGLYHPFMLIRGMVYGIAIPTLQFLVVTLLDPNKFAVYLVYLCQKTARMNPINMKQPLNGPNSCEMNSTCSTSLAPWPP